MTTIFRPAAGKKRRMSRFELSDTVRMRSARCVDEYIIARA